MVRLHYIIQLIVACCDVRIMFRIIHYNKDLYIRIGNVENNAIKIT